MLLPSIKIAGPTGSHHAVLQGHVLDTFFSETNDMGPHFDLLVHDLSDRHCERADFGLRESLEHIVKNFAG